MTRVLDDEAAVAYDVADDQIEHNGDVPLDTSSGTADDLFSVKPPLDKLYIPEVGKHFFVRVCDAREIDVYRRSITVGKGTNTSLNQMGMRAKLAVLALANPDGSRMFADGDVGRLQKLPAIVLERIFDRARKINGLTDEDTDEPGNA